MMNLTNKRVTESQQHRSPRAWTAIVMSVALLAACSSGQDDSTAPATEQSSPPTAAAEPTDESTSTTSPPATSSTMPPVPTTTPRDTRTLIQVDPDTGEASEVEVPDPGPTTYGEVVDFGIDYGLWSELEGVTNVLSYLVGALPAEQVPGVDEVITGEFSDMVERGKDLLAADAGDADQRAMLEQRMSLLSPSPDTLDAIAAQPGSLRSGFASRTAASSDCAMTDPDDWDQDAWLEGCYLVVERVLADATLRVYYPKRYDDDADLSKLPTVTLDALEKSITTYRDLGPVGDIDAIFSAADSVESDNAATSQRSMSGYAVDGCRITLFPATSVDDYRQTIAHEAWHCTQFHDGMEPDDADWFVEAGATFFSNVVYPAIDSEHQWLDLFDESLRTPLYDMSYEAWPWWQHLSNDFSPNFVADLHRSMYGTGVGIEKLDGMDEVFHDFVADLAAGVVIDQSGSALPRVHSYFSVSTVKKSDEGRKVTVPFASWAPMRWHIPYDKELRILETDATSSGLRSMVEWDDLTERAAWRGVYPEIRSHCTTPARFAGVSTDASVDGSTPNELEIVIDSVEQAECDPCLIGTWSLDLDTFGQMVRDLMQADGEGLPEDVSYEATGGAYYLAFEDDATILGQRDGLIVTMGTELGPLRTRIDGFASGEYSANGEIMTTRDLVASSNVADTNIIGDGGPRSVPSMFGGGGSGPYTCDDDTLQLSIGDAATVSFTRVDKILTPPDAPTDPATETPDD